jgi:8-oxo-dGTP pyrophosphatase MutT (NUDIX family)
MQNARNRNPFQCDDGVRNLSSCSLRVGRASWSFAEENAQSIEAHWIEAKQSNPNYFNGDIHLVDAVALEGGVMQASLLRTDFRSYLYWRANGFPSAGVLDGFGTALIRSQDGYIMLGLQRAGNVNGGFAYAPSGFIDAQDVDEDGVIHIARSALREATEETGIDPEALIQDEGFYLTRSGAQLSIAVPFRAQMTAAEFVSRAEEHIRTVRDSELDQVIPIAGPRDADRLPVPRYMRTLLDAIFAAG